MHPHQPPARRYSYIRRHVWIFNDCFETLDPEQSPVECNNKVMSSPPLLHLTEGTTFGSRMKLLRRTHPPGKNGKCSTRTLVKSVRHGARTACKDQLSHGVPGQVLGEAILKNRTI